MPHLTWESDRDGHLGTVAGRELGGRDYAVPYAPVGSRYGTEEIDVLTEVLLSGAPLSNGKWRIRFEEEFAAHVGSGFALSVTSGTVALEIAVNLLDLRPGDEVIVTPQSYHAMIQPLLSQPGVKVRFCDIDPDSLNLDVDCLQSMVNERTKAIILVHYGGQPANMAPIMRIAREHGCTVVEDCAHALGGYYRGRHSGSLADIGCFSLHSSKNISTLGEGGVITFDRPDWVERVVRIRGNQCDALYRPGSPSLPVVPRALYPGLAYTHDCVTVRRHGTNATMSEPAAAVGLVQLERLPELSARRRAIAGALDEALAAIPGVRVQRPPDQVRHAYHLYTFFVSPQEMIDRDTVVATLDRLGVQVWLRYFPLHLLPEWRQRGHRLGECPVAERVWFAEQINLPCHPSLTNEQVLTMLDAVRMAIEAGRRAGSRRAAVADEGAR